MALAACSQVALTGRSQLLLVPDAQVAELSRQSRAKFFQEAERANALVKPEDTDSGTVVPMVERVSNRIVQAAGVGQQTKWRVAVVRSKDVNASDLPSGENPNPPTPSSTEVSLRASPPRGSIRYTCRLSSRSVAKASFELPEPISSVSSSWTIFTTCWPGVRLRITS